MYLAILVLSHVSQIIQLYLIDFKYLNQSSINQSWFTEQKELKSKEDETMKKPVVILRKYLRKVLAFMNDQVRKNNKYQVRMFEPFN